MSCPDFLNKYLVPETSIFMHIFIFDKTGENDSVVHIKNSMIQ